jgi:hypothetical protein
VILRGFDHLPMSGLVLVGLLAAPPDSSLDKFLANLQRACARGDRGALAAMVQYPLTIFASGWNIPVKDRAAFLQYYDALFTDDIKEAIASASPPLRVDPAAAFLPFGNVLRIKPVGGSFRIVAIVMPPPGHKVRAARRETVRVTFPARQDWMAYAGSLAVGEHESYMVRAKHNDFLEVRIDGFAGRAIVAHVLDPTGSAVDVRAREGTRVWAGRVPAEGDYRIDVVRTTRDRDPALVYRLTVTLR